MNNYLQRARNTKNDEFFTTYETIEQELSHYTQHFAGKSILCNCDNPFKSNFCKFFLKNFNILKLKRLICTSYNEIGQGYKLDVTKFCDIDGEIPDEFILDFLSNPQTVQNLNGNGDFRSEECEKYLRICDIVITNPPFSLFREFVREIERYKKDFLLIGNQLALTYKDIFPLIKTNRAWTGYQFGEMKFRVPASSEPRATRYWVDQTGQKWRSLGNAMWLTNLDIERRHQKLALKTQYNPELYPRYDNFNAINVRTIKDIPYDYAGIMGVPTTIINRYNSEQFEIVGVAKHGSDSEYDLFKPILNGKLLFTKILIKNRGSL